MFSTNLTRQYNLNSFKDNKLIELVKSIEYNFYDDIVRFMEHKIIDMDTQKKLFQNKGNNIFLKSGIKLIKEGTELILDIKSKTKKINFLEKEIEDSIEKENKNLFSKSSFDNTKNIVVNKPNKNYIESPESKIETVAFPNKEMIKKENLSIIRKSLLELKLDNEIDNIFNGFIII